MHVASRNSLFLATFLNFVIFSSFYWSIAISFLTMLRISSLYNKRWIWLCLVSLSLFAEELSQVPCAIQQVLICKQVNGHFQLFMTLWTGGHWAPLSMESSELRILERVVFPPSEERVCVPIQGSDRSLEIPAHPGRWILHHYAAWGLNSLLLTAEICLFCDVY